MPQRKPYNPNTKYGRRKLREQAQYNYDNGTPEYRRDIDNIKIVVWLVVLGIAALFGLMVYATSGTEGLIKWLK